MIMSDSNLSDEEFDSEFDQSGYFSSGGDFLYLFIETLTGTSFEMRISPGETVIAIKAKLQQLEGIPVNQQHLLFNNLELPNNSTLQDCDVPDGATLKLVLAMRGGPINTRRIPLPEETAREIQDAVERNKEDLLGQIPEGGHVTVLVFREGDEINLYHVLERPDGSYSPLSDSWSGSSIRNLFAEQDDPDVQQRIQENANTMSKMQDLKNKMGSLGVNKSHVRRKISHDNLLPDIDSMNLPSISGESNLSSRWGGSRQGSGRETEITTITELGRKPAKNTGLGQNNNIFPEMKFRQEQSIQFSDTPPQSKRGSPATFVFGNPVPQRQSVLHPTQGRRSIAKPSSSKSSSKLISLDIKELNRNDENEGYNPTRRQNTRVPTTRSRRRRVSGTQEEDCYDLFVKDQPAREQNRLLNASQSSIDLGERLNKSLVESDFKPRRRRERSSMSDLDIKTVIDDQRNGNLSDNFKVPLPDEEVVWDTSTQPQPYSINNPLEHSYTANLSNLRNSSPGPRGMGRRLLNSRRGKLSRAVNSAAKTPRVLASPKGFKSPRTPRSGESNNRTFQTRPLSGPKKKKSSKPRCKVSDCRKKLTLTSSFSCRCEGQFCALHRHPETHACTFDYKTEGRRALAASNPMITIPKLPKI